MKKVLVLGFFTLCAQMAQASVKSIHCDDPDKDFYFDINFDHPPIGGWVLMGGVHLAFKPLYGSPKAVDPGFNIGFIDGKRDSDRYRFLNAYDACNFAASEKGQPCYELKKIHLEGLFQGAGVGGSHLMEVTKMTYDNKPLNCTTTSIVDDDFNEEPSPKPNHN